MPVLRDSTRVTRSRLAFTNGGQCERHQRASVLHLLMSAISSQNFSFSFSDLILAVFQL